MKQHLNIYQLKGYNKYQDHQKESNGQHHFRVYFLQRDAGSLFHNGLIESMSKINNRVHGTYVLIKARRVLTWALRLASALVNDALLVRWV